MSNNLLPSVQQGGERFQAIGRAVGNIGFLGSKEEDKEMQQGLIHNKNLIRVFFFVVVCGKIYRTQNVPF